MPEHLPVQPSLPIYTIRNRYKLILYLTINLSNRGSMQTCVTMVLFGELHPRSRFFPDFSASWSSNTTLHRCPDLRHYIKRTRPNSSLDGDTTCSLARLKKLNYTNRQTCKTVRKHYEAVSDFYSGIAINPLGFNDKDSAAMLEENKHQIQ